MRLSTFGGWLRAHQRIAAYTLVCAVVSLWTLLRFFTRPTIFDLVSQQVIVHQWLHGGMSAAHMGQTAYVPKMLLLYAPLDLVPGSPRLKLVLLTLAIDVATFVLIGLLAERLLRAYKVPVGGVFYTAFVWFATVAGSVLWIQFANSRNLEVAGGLLLLYLGVRFLERPGKRLAALVTLFGGLLFFDDPLQVYMTALPFAVYAGILAGTKREPARTVLAVCGALLTALGLSKALFALAGHWLHLTFTDTGGLNSPAVSAVWLAHSASGAARASVSLLAGADDADRLREAANLGLLLLGAGGVAYGIARRFIPRRLLLLAGCIWAVDMLVYIASGQAAPGGVTARYLIMTAPALLLLLGAVRLPKNSIAPAATLAGSVLTVNVTTLGAALAMHGNLSFPQDAHLASVQRFVQQNPDMHVYASTDSAMPVQYLYTLPAAKLLPVACLNGTLVRTHFSMDKEFAAHAADQGALAALVFDGDAVTNAPNICTASTITQQLGAPQRTGWTDDGSTVLYYPQRTIRLPG